MNILAFAILFVFAIAAGMISALGLLPAFVMAVKAENRRVAEEDAARIASERSRRLRWQLNEEHAFWLRQVEIDRTNADVKAYCAWKAAGGQVRHG